MSDEGLENLVRRAQLGEATALEAVVAEVQVDLFGLALRMLGHADDARDATQEVLIRLVTKLSTFRGESSFRTWVYRVAAHAILNLRGVLCLDRPHRLAYVLGEILEFPGEEAAAILEITHEAFRKRLSRAREEMGAFLRQHCGLADPSNRCRCARLLPTAMSLGVVDPSRPAYASLPTQEADRLRVNIDRVRSGAEVFRSLPRHGAPLDFTETVRGWLRDLSNTRN